MEECAGPHELNAVCRIRTCGSHERSRFLGSHIRRELDDRIESGRASLCQPYQIQGDHIPKKTEKKRKEKPHPILSNLWCETARKTEDESVERGEAIQKPLEKTFEIDVNC